MTPLLLAASTGQTDLVKCLCRARADPSILNSDGKSILQLASDANHIDMLNWLEKSEGENMGSL